MTIGFFQFFNDIARSNASSKKARAGRDRSPLKPRRLLSEALEERQLLAVDLAGAMLGASAADAQTSLINITSADYSIDAIKNAIEQAAATPEDEIIRVPSGTLTFASAADAITIDYDADVYGSITIQAVGGDVTIDAASFARAFTIKNGDVTLQSINIENGSSDYGGAIANAGSLTLRDVELTNNSATDAGGAIANKGTLAIQDSFIFENSTAGDGAAIYEGDFAWPTISAPEWTSQIPDQAGEAGSTLEIDLTDYCSVGDWTYSFTCDNPNANIFSAEPTLENGVLKLQFLSKSDYTPASAEIDLSAVGFTVTATDGTTSVSQSFNVAHALQTTVKMAAVISNMTIDDLDETYYTELKSGKKVVKWGYVNDEIPASEVADLSSEDLYVQVWAQDFDYDNDNYWNCGTYTIPGYVFTIKLTNATLAETHDAEDYAADAYGVDDQGAGVYRVAIGYTSGAPYGYADDGPAMLVDVLKISAIDPSKPVIAEISQASVSFTDPSMTRSYENSVTEDGRSYTKVDPSQILYVSSISNSTEPYSSLPGIPIETGSSAVLDGESVVLNAESAAAYSATISNSLIYGNSATGQGVLYVASAGEAFVYNATISDNGASNAAIFVEGTATVANSIVVNGSLASFAGSVSGSGNVNSGNYDSSKPLFAGEGDYYLAVGSQAANIGSVDFAIDIDGAPLTTDIAGNPRFSAIVDAGAYEYQGSAPDVPSSVTVSDYVDSNKNPTLSWTESDAIDGVDGYYVYYNYTFGADPIATVTVTTLENLASYVSFEDNSSYSFGVAAFNVYGVSPVRSVVLDTTLAPEAPTNLVFGEYEDNAVTLSWTGVDNATSYIVSVSNHSGYDVQYETTSTSVDIVDLEDNWSYAVVVTAVNSRGEAASRIATLDTTVAPAVPTDLVASPYTGDGTTTLSWIPVENADGYVIAQKVGDDWIEVDRIDEPDVSSYQLTGLSDNSVYTYGVAAFAERMIEIPDPSSHDGYNVVSDELVSDFAEITFATTVAPAAPTNPQWIVAYSNGSATLAWNPSENAVGYSVAVWQDGAWSPIDETVATEYTVTGLADNQEYVFGVAAYSTLGTVNLYSDYAQIALNTVVAPNAPTGARFLEYNGGTSADLTWTASVGGATGYLVQRQDAGEWVDVDTVDAVGFTAEVEENSFYSYRVLAFNQVGDAIAYSDPSNVAGLDTLTVPDGAIEVSISDYDPATGSLSLTWNNVDRAGYYIVSQKTANESDFTIVVPSVAAESGDTTSVVLTGLVPNATYQFKVVAANAKGEGSVGLSDDFYTATAPAAPVASYVYDSELGTATISYSSDNATSYVVTDAEGNVLYEGPETVYVAENLEENETYVFYVVAKNDQGDSDPTTVSVYTAAVPAAPTGLAFSEYVDNSATLSWNDVEAETGYRVYINVNNEWIVWEDDIPADTTELVMTDLEDYSTYTFRVTAFNAIGESAPSAPATLDTTVAPAAPADLAFTFGEFDSYQGDGKATISWSPVDHANGYRLEQNVEGEWTAVANLTTNSYDLTGLANYEAYDYRVAAYATKGTERLYSDWAIATLATDWIPTGDLNLTVGAYDATAKTAELAWNAAVAATSYKVEQFANGAWTSVGSTTETSYVLSLADNTSYAFRVVATNEVGDGSSDTVEFFTYAAPAAPVVSGVYDVETGSATISFSSPYATSYVLTDESGAELYSGSATSFVVAGLDENATYVFNVVASNEYGDSPATEYSLYTAAVPAAPTGLAFGEYADNSATLSWNPVDSATGYRVYLSTADGMVQVGSDLSAEQTSLELTNLAAFNEYVYCVSAFNAEGESALSVPATLDTTVAPASPTNVAASEYQGDGKTTISWLASYGAEGYLIYAKIDGAWISVDSTTATEYEFSDLENFNLYEFGVSAFATRSGETLESDIVAVEVDTTWIPTGELVVEASDYDYDANSATLTWTPVEHSTGYRVEQNVNGEWVSVGETTDIEYELALADNTSYLFRVVAFNEAGDGSFGEVDFFTFAPPAAPIDAAFGDFVAETGKATMTWSEVPYAEWYEVKTYVGGEPVVVQCDSNYFTAENLVEDAEYVYYVRACNHIGDTSVEGYSDWVEVDLVTSSATAPEAPSDFAVVGYDEASLTATLTWVDNAHNEERFVVERSLDGQIWTVLGYPVANATSCPISALQRGATYYYRIKATNQYGDSAWVSCEFTVPSGAPATPSDVAFTAYDAENKTFDMTWVDNSDNELYFKVEYSLDGETWGGAQNIAANETTATWTNLQEGQTYQFRVSAWNSYGVSEYAYGTFEIPVDGKTKPAAPSDIVFGDFNYANRTVQMSWTDNTQDETQNEDCFVVQYSFDGSTWRAAGVTGQDVTTRTATGMIVGREYYFRVCARNAAGDSDWAYGQFIAQTTLDAPEAFVFGEYSDGSLQTSWTYNGQLSENGGFVVQFSYDGTNWNRSGNTAYNVTERVATSVVPGRTYYFRVAAYDGPVYSDWLYSDAYVASGVPAAPSDLTFSDYANRSVQLSWIDNSASEVGFNVQYSLDGGETWISSGNTSANVATKTATNLRAGATYLFRVRAYNYFGASEWTTGEFTATTSEFAPNAPTGLTLGDYDPAAKTLGMSWTDNSNDETGFRVQYSYNGGKWYAAGNYGANVTERTATGLVAGRTYQFRVCAYNSYGESDWAYSEEFAVPIVEAVAAPSDLTAVYNAETGEVELAWTDNADGAAQVVVESRVDGTGEWTEIARTDAGAISYVVPDLAAGHSYEFRVKAVAEDGVSAASNVATVEIAAETVGSPVFTQIVYSGSARRTIRLAWSEVQDATYEFAFSLDQTNWHGQNVGRNSTTFNANPGRTYYFRVRAIAETGEKSEWSYGWCNTATGTTSLDAPLSDALYAPELIESYFEEF